MSTETRPPKRFNRKVALRAGTALLALCGVTAGGVSLAAASNGKHHRPRTLEIDVAEDGTRFVIDETPVFDDGFPAYGNSFITQGYIYPAGTLTDSNGVNPDGSPEFPDKVIGEWSCQGYFIADGAHTTEGSWVFTTQLFAFGNNADTGRNTLVVTGYEGAEVGKIVTGAITGGTGRYATARGDADQELIGINNPELPTMGINKTVEIELARP
jgi:outer membrane lipoprotein SlyB